jgi:hypothetical protein
MSLKVPRVWKPFKKSESNRNFRATLPQQFSLLNTLWFARSIHGPKGFATHIINNL